MDEIEKPGNLGAILRTAEAMGVKAVLLSEASIDFFNPNVIRSSMGLFATQPVFYGTKKEVLEWVRKAKLLVVGTSSHAKQTIYEYDFQSKIALLMGSESKGLGQFWENECRCDGFDSNERLWKLIKPQLCNCRDTHGN